MTPQVALITGAGSGMGQLAAWRLAEAGWSVAALDVNEPGLAATARRTPEAVRTYAVDVTDRAAVDKVVEAIDADLGPLVRVVNAAGIGRVGDTLSMDPGVMEQVMAVNYGGVVNVCLATLPGLLAQGRGELVNFASLAGWIPAKRMAVYNASKFAVVGFTESLRQEFRGSGVRIACVCPPAVKTPMLTDFFDPDKASRSMAITPERVIDSIESALAKDRLWVFPGAQARVLWRLRRFAPGLLQRLTNADRFDLARH